MPGAIMLLLDSQKGKHEHLRPEAEALREQIQALIGKPNSEK